MDTLTAADEPRALLRIGGNRLECDNVINVVCCIVRFPVHVHLQQQVFLAVVLLAVSGAAWRCTAAEGDVRWSLSFNEATCRQLGVL